MGIVLYFYFICRGILEAAVSVVKRNISVSRTMPSLLCTLAGVRQRVGSAGSESYEHQAHLPEILADHPKPARGP